MVHGADPSEEALQLQPLLPPEEGGATHCPAGLQTLGATQSSTETHEVLQPFLHAYGVQSWEGPVGGWAVWSSMHVAVTIVVHAPPTQLSPVTQSASTVHVVLHLLPSDVHTRLLHEWAEPTRQEPLPSQ